MQSLSTMKYFKKTRPIRDKINLFFDSDIYPIVIGIVAIISIELGLYKYMQISAFLLLAFCFAFLKNPKTIIAPALLYKLAKSIVKKTSPGISDIILYCKYILLLSIIYYIIYSILTGKKFTKGKLFWGFLFVSIATLMGGMFCDVYMDNFLGKYFDEVAKFVVHLFLMYIVLVNCLDAGDEKKYQSKKYGWLFSKNMYEYFFKCLIVTGFVVVVQIAIYYIQCDDILFAMTNKMVRLKNSAINSYALYPAMASLCLLYFSINSKQKWLCHFLSIVCGCFVILSFCRAAILITALAYPIALIYCGIKTKGKRSYWISFSIFLVLLLIAVFVVYEKGYDAFSYLKKLGLSGNGRDYWWDLAIKKFKENPIFGIGLYGDTSGTWTTGKWYFHQTLLSVLATTGIFGLLAYIVLYFQRYWLLCRKINIQQAFVLLIILMFEAQGMIDITMVRAEKWVLIILICVVVEISQKSNIKFDKLWIDSKHKKAYNQNTQNSSTNIINGGINNMEEIIEPTPISADDNNKPKKKFRFYRDFLKRFFDICISGFALLLLWPLFAVVAIISRFKIGKPVIFVQPRPGKNGKLFKLYKFRSMKNAVDKDGNFLPDKDRLTKWGRFLRKSSIDELPQLWNIFKGDMSIVGPRPHLLQETIFLTEEQHKRESVRPGLTCLSQVIGRNNHTLDVRTKFDMEYIQKCSMWLDIKIFFRTIVVVLKKEGVEKKGTASNELYGEYLLRTKQISQETYNEKMAEIKKQMGFLCSAKMEVKENVNDKK